MAAMPPQGHAVVSPSAHAQAKGLQPSRNCRLHFALPVVRQRKEQPLKRQQIIKVAADGSSNTAFAIEAPGEPCWRSAIAG